MRELSIDPGFGVPQFIQDCCDRGSDTMAGKLREHILFETTLAPQQPVPSFSYATERGAAQVAEGTDQGFHLLLDVRRARLQRIKPLASGDTQIVRPAAELEDSASVELLVEVSPSAAATAQD